MSDDGRGGDRGRGPVALIFAGALAVIIAVGAALGGSLRFTGPRWLPDQPPPTQKAVPNTGPAQVLPTASPPVAATGSGANFTWLAILIAVVMAAVLAFLVIRWLLAHRRDRSEAAAGGLEAVPELLDLPADPTLETSMKYLRRGLQRALDSLDGTRAPTDAIIEAWLGLQEAAEDAGFQRQSAETPTEFTTRILRQVDVDPTALATLRRLYLAVRFGDAVATDADVQAARSALETLEKQWATV